MPDNKAHICLSIAGFDPSAGAGVLADIQTMQGCKVNGMAALTAVTAQNEDKLTDIKWLNFDHIRPQLDALLTRYYFKVAKIGIVKNLLILNQLVDHLLKHNPDIKIIWDPILKSSSGANLMAGLEDRGLATVLPKIYLITPNLIEYELLQNGIELKTKTNVLIKGGHSQNEDTSDLLINVSGENTQISGQRIPKADKHGTGCVLSAAIASGLARGMKLKTACIFGKRYVEGYLRSGVNKLGAHYEIEI